MLEGKEVENEDLEKEKWRKIFDHKESVFAILPIPTLH